ncbi:MAG: methyltransferase domain-containing protein, partial [Methanophagales archaeon]|nr:methyltransferase domain-containing protein [Methanophagales archaeon]
YPNGYFDKIVCSSSLEHFKDDINALKEMHRVLKHDGRVVLTTDSFTYHIIDELKDMHRKIAHVVNYYTRETLKERFEAAGFELRRSEYLLNSWITGLFFDFGIKIRWSGRSWMGFFITYHLCLVLDRLFGARDAGYTLIVEGEKVK